MDLHPPPRIPSSDQREPISYAASPNAISVRGFRLLLFLTLVNTTLLGGFVLGPQLSGFARSQWAAYQERQTARQQREAARQQREAAMAAEASALVYMAAPGTLIYDDDPARRAPEASAQTPEAPWPAVSPRPAEAEALAPALLAPHAPVLFMHQRQASVNSPWRLVVVTCTASVSRTREFSHELTTRTFRCESIRPTALDGRMAGTEARFMMEVFIRPESPLRLYAGEPDPNDTSRFVIPYELAGERGLIHGQLQGDGEIHLTPDGPLTGPGTTIRRYRSR